MARVGLYIDVPPDLNMIFFLFMAGFQVTGRRWVSLVFRVLGRFCIPTAFLNILFVCPMFEVGYDFFTIEINTLR